jgi:gamma-glutamyl hercynylcysteine S-oxide synthase
MRLPLLILVLLAGPQTACNSSSGAGNAPGGPPLGPVAGSTPYEDLTSSWDPALAVPTAASASEQPAQCPDADGDGFVSAVACPFGDPGLLDCDDGDPAVTPAVERWVPPGPFLMGSESDHAGFDERPVHAVTLSGYCLDVHETTNSDFGRWLKETGRTEVGLSADSFEDGKVIAGRERHPVEGVSWQAAQGYCAARGKVLPTEAQWEKAARGGCELGTSPTLCDPADLRAYPWGHGTPTCELANHQTSAMGMVRVCIGDTVEVDSPTSGASPYGHLHLEGNVWEYVSDVYHPFVYTREKARVDPGGPAGEGNHILRGGAWNTFSTNMRTANRFTDTMVGSATGIRCARPTVDAVPDTVAPLERVTLSGIITREEGPVAGAALMVSAFDFADADPSTGMLAPGRSPVLETSFEPNGLDEHPFSIEVPLGRSYLLSAGLATTTVVDKHDGRPINTSGGMGYATENPILADQDRTGIHILLRAEVGASLPMGRDHGSLGGQGSWAPPGQGAGPMAVGAQSPVQGNTASSGGHAQDPSGFPGFHELPAPKGSAIGGRGTWNEPVRLSSDPSGGYRPQVAVGADGGLHVVFYERTDPGDVILHRTSRDGVRWAEATKASFIDQYNWGPDIAPRPDGTLVMVYEHLRRNFTGRGYLSIFEGGAWQEPEALTPPTDSEVCSDHIANGPDDELIHVWIGKSPGATYFKARWQWYRDGAWSEPRDFSDGTQDAWHTNVERRPDGSVLAGWDIGEGGSPTTLFVAEGRGGSFSEPENLTATGEAGERPHFAFAPDGEDHVTWFEKRDGRPLAVYTRAGGPGNWGAVHKPSAGFGGFHFDPEIAVNRDGVLCLVWGWDAGDRAEMVYSLDRGDGWEAPKLLAEIGRGKPGLASLVADELGNFHVVWNQGVRGDNEVYYSKLSRP